MARFGRGAVVALPALGAFFIAHLAKQDLQRLREERAAGRAWAARAFLVAFIGDVLDVGMHAVVVLGLLHHNFHVSRVRGVRRRGGGARRDARRFAVDLG